MNVPDTETPIIVSTSYESMARIADILGSLRKKGVHLWLENRQLRYKAPRGALTQEEIERLRVSRDQIVAHLESLTGAETAERGLPRSRLYRAPLAFSQLAHWYRYRLNERRAIREIASATRLRGRLNVEELQNSIAEVVRRHDALRTRIIVLDGEPMQEVSTLVGYELNLDDLTDLPGSLRDSEVRRVIEKQILNPIDITAGPLFGVRLLRLRGDEHVLIMALEHIISDMHSLSIILGEVLTAYMQVVKGHAFSLPRVPVQFADYALRQRNTHTSWREKHDTYWNERLAGCQRLRFPDDKSSHTGTHLGWGIVPVQIGIDLKMQLREWCRQRQTTLVMSVFTAYVGLVSRWCNTPDFVIKYQSDGRVGPELQNTVGYFASELYLRIGLLEDDSVVDLLNRVTNEYCKAYEHADSSYFAAQVPRPEWAMNSIFNWLREGPKLGPFGSADELTCSLVNFEPHPMARNLDRDNEPFIALSETEGGEIAGGIWFSLNRFSVDTMERFGRNFLLFIRALLMQPVGRVKDILLV
jgi:hypothetical protein